LIGAEAKIAKAYHAIKLGDYQKAIELLSGIQHARAQELLAIAKTKLQEEAS